LVTTDHCSHEEDTNVLGVEIAAKWDFKLVVPHDVKKTTMTRQPAVAAASPQSTASSGFVHEAHHPVTGDCPKKP
jgi:hypothetical protein